MRLKTILLLLLFGSFAYSQSNSIQGTILDEKGVALSSSTVVLLDPADSTLQHFGITNASGQFVIKGITRGNYLLQAAFIGYNSYYKDIEIPSPENEKLGIIVMMPSPLSMDEVKITGERVPLQFRQDTIEYDAKAFKVSPDAVVEDLLKKLPGVEVDRAGNIKALGENVSNVLVDGKEFFSGDPKVATKNLPANALDKVQVYNKRSEEAEFTGIDDGTRNQTVNLILDEDKKVGAFGEVQAGGGTGKHYDTKAKVYKFTNSSQIAALGMLNNVNKFGFSFRDYLSFVGGISNMSHGKGGMSIGEGSFPINFGETITGHSSSGAGGLNYSYSKSKHQRFFISYLGSASKRNLSEQVRTTRYLETDSYIQNEQSEQIQHDTSHSLNFGVRYLFRETNNIIFNGGISYNTGYIPLSSELRSFSNDILINELNRTSTDLSDRLSGNMQGSYLKKINEGTTIFKVSGNGSYNSNNSETNFENQTSYYNQKAQFFLNQFQDNTIKTANYGGAISLTQKLFESVYMDISLKASATDENLARRQGIISGSESAIDSLSPDFVKEDRNILPTIAFRRNTEKSSLTIGADYNIGNYSTKLWSEEQKEHPYQHIQPRLSWEYRYKPGRRLGVHYSTRTNNPTANQLLPVVNNFNSLSLFYGNPDLNPEYSHSLAANWMIFDQFSFTTLMSSLRANYTGDKINYARTVNDQLQQVVQLVNVESDYSIKGSIDLTTPIKFLGIKTNIDLSESYNRGINIVNGIENDINSLQHKVFVSFDNRKKVKWDISTGAGMTMTDANYSIQESLNNVYFDVAWFGEIRYNPSEKFEFFISTDVTNYTARSFDEARLVPLLGAEMSYFFMKNNRATLTLSGFDLLDKNTGISRISEMNYLEERRSNIIGRYFMLTFKYRLNKAGGDTGLEVNMKKRR
jgi:hypothetical protein